MKMPLRGFLCVLWPNGNSVCRLRCEKSWRACLHLQSAQNVKVKLLSIIRGVSTEKLLLTYFHNPLPLPQQFKRDPLGKRGFWVGVKLVKCRKKKKKE